MVQFGVHFGNSVLDNSNWLKISHILTKNYTHLRKVGHTSEFFLGIYWWPLKDPKNQTFEKMKKFAEDIIILRMISFMRYSSWNTKWDRIFCQFRSFLLLAPNNLENQHFEEIKKAFGDVIILNLGKKNTMIWCMLTQICSAHTDIIFRHFKSFFAILPHYWHLKLKFGKNVKTKMKILSSYTLVP